jgi:hypothetical protein
MDGWIHKNRSVAFLAWYVKGSSEVIHAVAQRFDTDYSITSVVAVALHDQAKDELLDSAESEFLPAKVRQTDITLWNAFDVDLYTAFPEALSCHVVVILAAAMNLDALGKAMRELKDEGCDVVVHAVNQNPDPAQAKWEVGQLVDAICAKLELHLRDRDVYQHSSRTIH